MKKLISIFTFILILIPIFTLSVLANVGFASGSGYSTDPYIIETAAQFQYFAQCVNNGNDFDGKYISLSASISLSNISVGNSENPFCGVFKGNGNTITLSSAQGGVFGFIENGSVYNLKVSFTQIDNDCKGAICDQAEGSYFEGCTSESGNSAGDTMGGIVGYAEGCDFVNCSNNCNIYGNNIGGIVGISLNCNLTQCTNNGNLTALEVNCGGIAGKYLVSPTDNLDTEFILNGCKNYSSVDGGNYDNIGGIVGYAQCDLTFSRSDLIISNCENSAQIEGTSSVGGIVGFAYNKSESGVSFGTSKISIQNCKNNSQITAFNYSGGIIGHSETIALENYNAETVISLCDNIGNIQSENYSGGLAGFLHSVSQLNGLSETVIEKSINLGSVSGNTRIGGISGFNKTEAETSDAYIRINNCYNTGNITSNSEYGGISGGNSQITIHPSDYSIVQIQYVYNSGLINNLQDNTDYGLSSFPTNIWGSNLYTWYPQLALIDLPHPNLTLGDVNGDGNINAADYFLLESAVLGDYELDARGFIRSDMNGDGNLSAVDYLMLKRIVLG